MATEQFGDIVIAPRVLEKIIAIATAKVEGVYSLENKSVSDSLSKRSLGRGVYLHTEEDGQVSVDIYLYLEYGVAVPSGRADGQDRGTGRAQRQHSAGHDALY